MSHAWVLVVQGLSPANSGYASFVVFDSSLWLITGSPTSSSTVFKTDTPVDPNSWSATPVHWPAVNRAFVMSGRVWGVLRQSSSDGSGLPALIVGFNTSGSPCDSCAAIDSCEAGQQPATGLSRDTCQQPTSCVIGAWRQWGGCRSSQGICQRQREPNVTQAGTYGGQHCDDLLLQVEECINLPSCGKQTGANALIHDPKFLRIWASGFGLGWLVLILTLIAGPFGTGSVKLALRCLNCCSFIAHKLCNCIWYIGSCQPCRQIHRQRRDRALARRAIEDWTHRAELDWRYNANNVELLKRGGVFAQTHQPFLAYASGQLEQHTRGVWELTRVHKPDGSLASRSARQAARRMYLLLSELIKAASIRNIGFDSGIEQSIHQVVLVAADSSGLDSAVRVYSG